MTQIRPIIGLLGAEKQAAVSAALAWPERNFLFLSDQRVIDGWDLPNVEARWASPGNIGNDKNILWVPLCARWQTSGLRTAALSTVMDTLVRQFGEIVLPVSLSRPNHGSCMVKGNHWHRPDSPLWGEASSLAEVTDPYGCSLVYQPYWPRKRHFLATGRRLGPGAVELAVVAVHAESCARDDVLAAGETVSHDRIAGLTLDMMEALDQRGFFSFNWLERDDAIRLTSVRPVPRALFRSFRRAGWDSFSPGLNGVHVAPAGLRFTVDIHYSSYQPLVA